MTLRGRTLLCLIACAWAFGFSIPALGSEEAPQTGEAQAATSPEETSPPEAASSSEVASPPESPEDVSSQDPSANEAANETSPDGAFEPGHFDDEGNWVPEEDALTGDEIYKKVLDNRFNSYEQELTMESGDRGGNRSHVEMEVKYMSLRDTSKKVLSNTIAKYHEPMDVRHMGYLVINKSKGTDDQFVYLPSNRRVRRINLRGESIVGTDFNLEDIVPREFEDATYKRLPDHVLQGIECYAVEVIPTEESDSEYSKFIAYIDKKTFVPIENVYWDRKGILIKKLSVQPDSITRFEDVDKAGPRIVWVALHSRVENVKLDTYTNLEIEKIKANPGLGKRHFSQRQLTSGR